MQAQGETAARALRTPRAAGAAGIIFGLLLGIAIVSIRRAIPADPGETASWVTDPLRRQTLQATLDLVPFAGISFLWFMGAVRDRVGEAEDRFFATIFLGSGLLLVAMLFVLATSASSLLAGIGTSGAAAQPALWQYSRQFTLSLLTDYAMRMAAVFAISTSVIGQRLGVFPRPLVWLGCLVAPALLVLAGRVAWSELMFPIWVLAVSGYILLTAGTVPPWSGRAERQ